MSGHGLSVTKQAITLAIVPTEFASFVDLLDATCDRFLQADDASTRDALARATHAFTVPPDLSPPVIKGLANVVWTRVELLKDCLIREDVTPQAALQLRASIADLKAEGETLRRRSIAAPENYAAVMSLKRNEPALHHDRAGSAAIFHRRALPNTPTAALSERGPVRRVARVLKYVFGQSVARNDIRASLTASRGGAALKGDT